MLLGNKYTFIENIKNGEFGSVVKVSYKNKYYAMKKGDKELIKYESEIYKKLKNSNNISKIYDIIENDNKLIMVMDYYILDFNQYKSRAYYSINYVNNILTYMKDLINIIKYIHKNDIIHRDLKPTNICLDNNYKLFLIDFGISKIYKTNNKHNDETKIHSIIGSINFSSLNVLNLIEPSRRDDIESIIYIFIYMLLSNEYYIAYNNLDNIKKKNIDIIINILKLNTYQINYDFFYKLFNYIRRLKYNQEPNYNYIVETFNQIYMQ